MEDEQAPMTTTPAAATSAPPPPPPPPPAATPTVTPSTEQHEATALATEAENLYNAKQYSECIALLEQLLVKRDNDPKILLNIALSEFHRDGCNSTTKLVEVLDRVKTRCEELARAADEQLEGTSITTSIEVYDASVPILNMAIVHYHLQEYERAMEVLMPLMANIEPVDESTALQVCLLALDLALGLRQPRKAAAVIRYMEKSYGLSAHNSSSESGNVPAVQSGAGTTTSVEGRNLTVGIGGGGLPSPLINSPSAESSLTQSSGPEENFEEDISLGLMEYERHPAPRVGKSSPAPATDLKLQMHLYKVRLLLMTQSLKPAKREVKSALNLSKDNLTALLLKAQLEYLAGNYPKAQKLLMTCYSHKEAAIAPMVHSNLGLVYAAMHKHQTASFQFVKALQMYTGMAKEKPRSLRQYSRDRAWAVYYNAGLEKLIAGDPVLAFVSFKEAAPHYANRPIFWLRLAECCISALDKGLVKDVSPRRTDLKVVAIGRGKWRRLVLPSGSMNPAASAATSEGNNSNEPTVLTMSKAKEFLAKALFLVKKAAASEATTEAEAAEDGAAESTAFVTNSSLLDAKLGTSVIDTAVASYEAQLKEEKPMVTLAILADYAFVELCLENPIAALKCAGHLLQHPKCTNHYRYLGRVYAAEALCLLNRPKEGEDHLRACIQDAINVSMPEGDSLDRVQALYVNLAAVHALQGDLEQARHCASEARSGSNLATLAAVYVDLAQGRSKEALKTLKAFRRLSISCF